MLPKDCGPSSVVFSDIIMLHRCLNDIIMSLNSIYMLVKVLNDIIMLQRCLNDIIMFWEQKGTRLRGMSHTHTHCDSSCCADLSHQHDVCCLKQTCTPKGAARKYLTTVTDVMILTGHYAVGLEVARGTQSNTQGMWPCKLPIDSLPPQLLAKSPKLMSDLCKQSRRNFPNAVAG